MLQIHVKTHRFYVNPDKTGKMLLKSLYKLLVLITKLCKAPMLSMKNLQKYQQFSWNQCEHPSGFDVNTVATWVAFLQNRGEKTEFSKNYIRNMIFLLKDCENIRCFLNILRVSKTCIKLWVLVWKHGAFLRKTTQELTKT